MKKARPSFLQSIGNRWTAFSYVRCCTNRYCNKSPHCTTVHFCFDLITRIEADELSSQWWIFSCIVSSTFWKPMKSASSANFSYYCQNHFILLSFQWEFWLLLWKIDLFFSDEHIFQITCALHETLVSQTTTQGICSRLWYSGQNLPVSFSVLNMFIYGPLRSHPNITFS